MTVRNFINIVLHVGLKCTFKQTFSLCSIVKEYVDTKLNFCFDKKNIRNCTVKNLLITRKPQNELKQKTLAEIKTHAVQEINHPLIFQYCHCSLHFLTSSFHCQYQKMYYHKIGIGIFYLKLSGIILSRDYPSVVTSSRHGWFQPRCHTKQLRSNSKQIA